MLHSCDSPRFECIDLQPFAITRISRGRRAGQFHSCGDIRSFGRSGCRRGRRQTRPDAVAWICWSPKLAACFPSSMWQRRGGRAQRSRCGSGRRLSYRTNRCTSCSHFLLMWNPRFLRQSSRLLLQAFSAVSFAMLLYAKATTRQTRQYCHWPFARQRVGG